MTEQQIERDTVGDSPTQPSRKDPLAARLEQVQKLLDATEHTTPLSQVVQANLEHLWSTGGRRSSSGPGRQPSSITIRFGFVHGMDREKQPSDLVEPPPLARLVEGRGLALKLLLLMIFDEQCRHRPGDRATSVHRVRARTEQDYHSWTQLILTAATPQAGSGSGVQQLRARQVQGALRVLERLNLVNLPAQRRRGDDSRFDRAELLSEEGLPSRPAYRAAVQWGTTFKLPREFFTNLWVFALTDAEIANLLMFYALRSRFPQQHSAQGVFATTEDRQSPEGFGLSSAVYRSHAMLHRYRLIDRFSNPHRSYTTGVVKGFRQQWENGSVEPHRFRVVSTALDAQALQTIHQTISAPTFVDQFRMAGWLAPEPSGADTSGTPNTSAVSTAAASSATPAN